jgi:hypothetical protein
MLQFSQNQQRFRARVLAGALPALQRAKMRQYLYICTGGGFTSLKKQVLTQFAFVRACLQEPYSACLHHRHKSTNSRILY